MESRRGIKMSLRRDAAIYTFIVIVLIVVLSLIKFESTDTFYKVISAFSIIVLYGCLQIEKNKCGRYVTFTSLFLGILFLFTFGQPLLLAIQGGEGYTIVIEYYGEKAAIESLRLIFMSYSCVCVGCALSKRRVSNNQIASIQVKYDDAKEYRYAKTILLLTFPVRVALDLFMLVSGLVGGWSAGRLAIGSIPDVIVSYGKFSVIGMGLLIFSLRSKPKSQTRTFLIFAAYFTIIMLGGRRSESVAYMCILLLVYLGTRKKIKALKTLQYAVAGYVFLGVMYAFVYMRFVGESYSVHAYFTALVRALAKENVLFEALREYGNTCYTAISAIARWLPENGPTWGKSYWMGISAVFPNIGGVMGELTRMSTYGFSLQDSGLLSSSYFNIGGSIIGEWFFNFGIFGGLFVSLLFGFFVGRLSNKVSDIMQSQSNQELAYYIPIMTSCLYWVRSYFSGGIREVVWGIAFVFITRSILLGRASRNSYSRVDIESATGKRQWDKTSHTLRW